jgi:nucleotide-binding universal stress UspA family protein
MYKKILVPLDGSELSERALSHMKTISTGCNVPKVALLMVVRPIDNSEILANLGIERVHEIENQEIKSAEDYITKIAKVLAADGITPETTVLKGNPAQEILEYIDENLIDLVIMSSHGHSGPSSWFLGNVADRIIKHSKVPVLVVRTGLPAGD